MKSLDFISIKFSEEDVFEATRRFKSTATIVESHPDGVKVRLEFANVSIS